MVLRTQMLFYLQLQSNKHRELCHHMFANLTNRLTEQEGKCYICSEAAIGGVLLKESVFKNFTKFTAKHLCQGLFFNKKGQQLFLKEGSGAYVFL